MKPSVGIVMATYNGERFIEEQLDSIFSQTRPPDLVVVTDDASTDRTAEIVLRYARKYPVIEFHQNEKNRGFTGNFEKGISLCGTDFIALSDQDDIWEPDKLETCLDALTRSPEAGLCFHDSRLIYGDGRALDTTLWALRKHVYPLDRARARRFILQAECPISGFSMAFHRGIKDLLLPFPGQKLYAHDWWICAVAFFMHRPVAIAKPLSFYRMHIGQASGAAEFMLDGTKYKIKKNLLDLERIKRNVRRETNRILNRGKILRAREEDRKRRNRDFSTALERLLELLQDKGPGPESERLKTIEEIKLGLERLQK